MVLALDDAALHLTRVLDRVVAVRPGPVVAWRGVASRVEGVVAVLRREVIDRHAPEARPGGVRRRERLPFLRRDPEPAVGDGIAVGVDVGDPAAHGEDLHDPPVRLRDPHGLPAIEIPERYRDPDRKAEEVLSVENDRLVEARPSRRRRRSPRRPESSVQ